MSANLASTAEHTARLQAATPVEPLEGPAWLVPPDGSRGFTGDPTIDAPSHYVQGDGRVQPIDLIESQALDYRAGNVIKYVCRHQHKGMPLRDLKKAQWYLTRMIADVENEEANQKLDRAAFLISALEKSESLAPAVAPATAPVVSDPSVRPAPWGEQ